MHNIGSMFSLALLAVLVVSATAGAAHDLLYPKTKAPDFGSRNNGAF